MAWRDSWHEVSARRVLGIRPSSIGLQLLAAASEAAARDAIGVTPLEASLEALGTLLAGDDQPNNDCWEPVRIGEAWGWAPRLNFSRRVRFCTGNGLDATFGNMGWASAPFLLGGSSSGFSTVSIGGITRGYVPHTCTATTGQRAGRMFGSNTTGQLRLDSARLFGVSYRFPTNATNVRFKAGMSASDVSLGASVPPNNTLEVRWDPGANDTTMILTGKDTTTVLASELDAAFDGTAGAWHEVVFSVAPGGGSIQVWGEVNGTGIYRLLATRTTSLPAPTTALFLYCGLETRANEAKTMGIGSAFAVDA